MSTEVYYKKENYCVVSGTYVGYGVASCTVTSGTIYSGGGGPYVWGPTTQIQFFDGTNFDRATISGLMDILYNAIIVT